MKAENKIRLVNGTEIDESRWLDFAAKQFGKQSYQALAGLYRWQYVENPSCKDGLAAMILAVDSQDVVVGSVHRVFVDWMVAGEVKTIPALVDLAVDQQHRVGGLGLRLMMKSTQGQAHAFVNGSNSSSGPLFRSLKYQEILGGRWFRKVLRPVQGAVKFALHRLAGWKSRPANLDLNLSHPNIVATLKPDANEVQSVLASLNSLATEVRPFWTVDSFHWRFFHSAGPKHMLLYQKGEPWQVMVISLGESRGLGLCRLVACAVNDPKAFQELLGCAIQLVRRAGYDVFSSFTFSQSECQAFVSAGFSELKVAPSTFFYHKKKADAVHFDKPAIYGAPADFGFDALLRRD